MLTAEVENVVKNHLAIVTSIPKFSQLGTKQALTNTFCEYAKNALVFKTKSIY